MTDLSIDVEGLSFSYETIPILRKVQMHAVKGEFIGIMGPNGGGKTTLLKLLMGFLRASRGKITVLNRHPEEVRTQIGYVPQAHKMDRDFPITLLEQVLLGALSKTSSFGIYPRFVKERAHYLIERLGLGSHKNKAFGSLSGGLAQRALLARSLLSDPDLLLLDEPAANIDPPSQAVIFDLLESLKGKKTILLVTHDLKTVIERVDRVLCVQGEIHSYVPKDVCGHFAMGLYHTPLMGIHSKEGSDAIKAIR